MNTDSSASQPVQEQISEGIIDVITYNLIGDGFWEIVSGLVTAIVRIGMITAAITLLWFVVYFVIKRFSVDESLKFKLSTINILKDVFIYSQISEGVGNLIVSIYNAVSSIANTLGSIISIAFTSFTVIIELPFGYIQRFFEKINEYINQKNHVHRLKLEETRRKRKHELLERKMLIEKQREEMRAKSAKELSEDIELEKAMMKRSMAESELEKELDDLENEKI
ncbi:MAG: hypothetical protein ABW168_03900 [Sedimenticola sp.]